MKILIKNGRVVDPASGRDERADVAIASGRIVTIGTVGAECRWAGMYGLSAVMLSPPAAPPFASVIFTLNVESPTAGASTVGSKELTVATDWMVATQVPDFEAVVTPAM